MSSKKCNPFFPGFWLDVQSEEKIIKTVPCTVICYFVEFATVLFFKCTNVSLMYFIDIVDELDDVDDFFLFEFLPKLIKIVTDVLLQELQELLPQL